MNCEKETEKGKNAKRIILSLYLEGGSSMQVMKQIKYEIRLIIMHYYCFTLLLLHCMFISFTKTPRFQIIYNCNDVNRHSSERINYFLWEILFHLVNKSVVDQIFGTNYVRHMRFHCIYKTQCD